MIQALRFGAGVTVLLVLCAASAFAQTGKITDADLYKAEPIVTGTGEAERLRGFRLGAEEAAIKLTGDAKLAGSDRLKPILDRAAGLVAGYTYEDRMKSIPVHDEQGTRDRPHFLRIAFDTAKFDEALLSVGLKKWSGERPLVAVWLAVQEPRGKYVLTADGPEGYGQREVLKEASVKRAVPIVLPPRGQDAVTFDTIANGLPEPLQREAEKLSASTVLYGTLSFDGNVAWNTRWTLVGQRVSAQWSMEGVTFDVALKGAIERSAAALAGSGQ